jgi:hypothetical protein
VGNPVPSNPNVTGTISFSINGGVLRPIVAEVSGYVGGDTTFNDLALIGNTSTNVANGSTVVLSAGTVTTTTNIAAARPVNGSYITYITNQDGARCSSNGVAAVPTAATVSISGRVTSTSGRGVFGIVLSLTDSEGYTRTTRTTAFGYYHFEDVMVGESYILSASGKHYTFSQPTQVLNVNEETNEVNFIANSEKSIRVF